MSYKRYLFETGGFAYPYYEYARTGSAAVDEQAFADIHNGLRTAASNIVGLSSALAASALRRARFAATTGTGYQNSMAMSTLANEAYASDSENAAKVANSFAKTPFVGIRKEGDTISLVGKAVQTRLIINPFDKDQERFLAKLLPGYSPPVNYVKGSGYGIRAIEPKWSFEGQLQSNVNQDTLSKLLSSDFNAYLPEYAAKSVEFEAVKKLPNGLGVLFSLRLKPANSSVQGMPFSVDASEGSLPATAAVSVAFDIVPVLQVPMDYALWATYSEKEDEFVPFLFMTHINALIQAAGGKVGDKNEASFIGNASDRRYSAWRRAKARKPTPVAMARRNLEKEKETGYKPQVRTNPDGYIITSGDIAIKLPTEGKMVDYQNASNEWFGSLSDEQIEALSTGSRNAPKFKFPPSILYVDHHHEVMAYTTHEGTVTSLNLRGARPLDEITITKKYPEMFAAVMNNAAFNWEEEEANLSNEGKTLRALWGLFNRSKNEHDKQLSNYIALGSAMAPNNLNPIRVNFENDDYYRIMPAIRASFGYNAPEVNHYQSLIDTLQNGAGEEQTGAEDEIIKLLNKGNHDIAAICQKTLVGWSDSSEDGAVINRLQANAACYIVATHSSQLDNYETKRRSNLRENVVDGLDRDKPLSLPNVDPSSLQFLFPHQTEFVQNVDRTNPPKLAVIGASPGGGKSNMILADILLLLQKGLIKRPVVAVPNNLVRQFVSEINEFTNGKVNAFPFTWQHVMNSFSNPYGMNMSTKDISKFMRDLPPNTIIVTNYNTLRHEYSDQKDKYEEVPSYDNFGTAKPLRAYPFVDILAAAGVDYVCGDESHKIKNQDSGLAQAFLCLCSKAEYVRLSSGTTVNNVVTDLVGQTQKLNPAILGANVEKFAENFLGSSSAKMVANPEDAEAISEAMREYALVMQRDSRSWDYMLPPLREIYHRVSLTPMQTRFYQVLFAKAINRIKLEGGKDLEDVTDKKDDDEKKDRKLEKVVAKHFSVIDRFVNAPNLFSEFEDGSFVYDEYEIKNGYPAADGSLEPAKIEPDDLISVKAKYAYDLLYAHMNERGKLAEVQKEAPTFTADPGNKVILMAPNVFVGDHVWNNMPKDLKSRAVRYKAGDTAKVERFKADDKIKFMVADEISISEGHNLQVGSRIIRMQQVWTPGGETQTLARIRRPDPFAKFNRSSLGYDIIVATQPSGRPTIDDLRIARLLAKKFNNAMVEFNYEPSFRKEFLGAIQDPLPPVRMSMDTIQNFPEEMLNAYFDQQQKFNTWFAKSSADYTKKIGREVEAITGQKLLDESGRPIDRAAFVKAVVVPMQEAPEIQGSSNSYVPFFPGAQAINPLGFPMQPIRSLSAAVQGDADDSNDDENDEVEDDEDAAPDNVECKPGMHVITEFGPGILVRELRAGKGGVRKNVEVRIPSMKDDKGKPGRIVRLSKTCVYVPFEDDEEAHRKLAASVAGKSGQPPKVPTPKGITPEQRKKADDRKKGEEKPAPDFDDYDSGDDFDEDDFDLENVVVDDDEPEDPIDVLIDEEDNEDFEGEGEEEEETEEEEQEPEPTIFAQALAINGELAIIADDTAQGDALDELFTRYGFSKFPDMIRVGFKTHKALDTFLNKLTKAKFVIPRPNQAEIETVSTGIGSRGRLSQLEPFNYSEITNFMKTEQKMVPKRKDLQSPQTFRLYPLVCNGKFYLCASTKKHPFNVRSTLTKLISGISDIIKPQSFDNMAVRFYTNVRKAQTDAKRMISDGDLLENGGADLLESFDSIKNGHIEMPKGPAPKPVTTTTQPPKPKTPVKTQRISMDEGPSGYREEALNPKVTNMAKFKAFLGKRRATITLIRGSVTGVPKNTPLRVRKFGTDHFVVAKYPNAPAEDRIEFGFPAGSTFDPVKGTMTTKSGSVWRLTYAGE